MCVKYSLWTRSAIGAPVSCDDTCSNSFVLVHTPQTVPWGALFLFSCCKIYIVQIVLVTASTADLNAVAAMADQVMEVADTSHHVDSITTCFISSNRSGSKPSVLTDVDPVREPLGVQLIAVRTCRNKTSLCAYRRQRSLSPWGQRSRSSSPGVGACHYHRIIALATGTDSFGLVLSTNIRGRTLSVTSGAGLSECCLFLVVSLLYSSSSLIRDPI